MNDLSNLGPIATKDEFKNALLATRDWRGISPTQLQMLQAQCRAPASTITADQLASTLNLRNAAAARLEYSTFARAVAEKLGYEPPHAGKGPMRWWFTLSVVAPTEEKSDATPAWIMRPELVEALRYMKWA